MPKVTLKLKFIIFFVRYAVILSCLKSYESVYIRKLTDILKYFYVLFLELDLKIQKVNLERKKIDSILLFFKFCCVMVWVPKVAFCNDLEIKKEIEYSSEKCRRFYLNHLFIISVQRIVINLLCVTFSLA